ncbi:aromatic ring-hydroxylating dioxygenase subunit alpha [Alcaligenes faecalis]|uniref:aromatic ring-hydroxylating dioxygenase subunit alpha n=1 Tax=Alcaligenes faecalis TaxID=511 RepID=UPI0005A6E62E|nr:aromatic ring-hydroxylating dioxygenase subunit alpha [Alcaligenes faecalis]ATI01258.1 aromatic ring-hydroxylating dioxygenase subunit alpha [Alcaligenes faecalis]AYZ90615.1 aromatic ring-hydroxylating dioxygenase subunit alpha [Alcaligenes faecalis]MCX5595246.1 aromatic ring-hydroxylating dioxygenase subunit alpha [Alcaligenes faecalis]QQC33562.1 aromatic ring-hydroxylating dioxygenase subunit alpha [Alcaligenes faecalis]CAJ0910745.1 vanillate monooxygenase [Alcaligenes faecalis subsp. fae
MFVRNAWYVGALATQLGRSLQPVRMLGENLVLYRREDGQPVALEDSCPHRRLPLSKGRLIGDQVECGYHGLTFDCSGSCTKAPGVAQIPKSAVVRSYPCTERFGLVWIWMGDPELADPSKLVDIPEWDNPEWGVNRGDAMELDCNYLYVTDNLLDPSHVSWVHQSSFGSPDIIGLPLTVKVEDNGVTVSRWSKNVEVAPFYKQFVKFEGNCDRKQQYEVRFPSLAVIKAIFLPAGAATEEPSEYHQDVFLMDSYNFLTPIDEEHTRYFWFQLRNFSPDDEAISKIFNEDVRHAFLEDKVVLEEVHKALKERPAALDLPLDSGPLRFRRKISQMIQAEQAVASETATA